MFFPHHKKADPDGGWAFVNYSMLYDINEPKSASQGPSAAKVHRGENLINVHSINLELNYIFKPCFACSCSSGKNYNFY